MIESEINKLKEKAGWVRRETLRLHALAPQTRVASSLSCVEILTVLYYGGILRFDPDNVFDEGRDRFVVSKGHGSISMYPILADLGFIGSRELEDICKNGSCLGGIPDPIVPGYETINGSLGHGLGVACGIALALKHKGSDRNVFVLLGDGELYEGSNWEAIMFASQHKLDNLILIIDNNKVSMLDLCKNIIDLEPLDQKFEVFGWETRTIDGHDIKVVTAALTGLKEMRRNKPKVVIADTLKGKGVPRLENDPLSHIRVLDKSEVESLLEKL
ncbi:MAG: transketolase [Candidatus Margulisiibacteriota bacterium]